MKSLLLLLALVVPATSLAAGIERFCLKTGESEEAFCSVSLPVLIARGEDFDGRLVYVTGYFAHGDVSVLFSSTESFLTSNVADGLTVHIPGDKKLAAKLYGLDHTMVRIRGRFRMKPTDTTGYSAYHTSGQLLDITEIGEAFGPWGFSFPVPGERHG
jgi:hypothetical protein